MSMANRLIETSEYLSFRSGIPHKRVIVDDDDSKVWSLYDAGPKSVKSPIICLPPASGKAEVFYRQVFGLSSIGYRAIALDYPVYWSVDEFCTGLCKIIEYLHLEQIHIFGCSLGAYLGLKFAERMRQTTCVASMVLCNGFTDTSVFKYTRMASAFWMIPAFILKRLILSNYKSGTMDAPQADATDFVVDCLDSLSQQEIASRLMLHCNGEYLRKPHALQHIPVTILDVFDESALSQSVKDDMYKCFPNAKKAHLKSGGNFPYLSRAAEVNLHIRIHLKPFEGTTSSPKQHLKCEENNQYASNARLEASLQRENPSIMRSSITSDDSGHSEGESAQPRTLLEISKMRQTEDLDEAPPTIEVDDDISAIDFPI